ncbi:MAG: DUF5916 domain-containing protein [Pseudomonadota bacterium]
MYLPIDRWTIEFRLRYFDRNSWLIHLEDRELATFDADDIRPSISSDFFITAKQQLRLSLQWVGLKADERQRYEIPPGDGDLEAIERNDDPADFAISNMVLQLRYRWEIAPLSDLFVVYTRGGNLASSVDADFDRLFTDTFSNPDVDSLIVKFRYRLGS